MRGFSIERQWASSLHETAEISQTSAMLKIVLGDEVVTRNEDEWAQTVREDARLSAYPLALWLASSWWRLRWEPLPNTTPTQSWRMAHELGAVGFGYVWPRVLFAPDGDSVHAWAVQTPSDARSPLRYLTNAYSEVSASEFERTIDIFIAGVLARLDAVNAKRTDLHDLWSEVLDERADGRLSAHRRLEALLGFDPDESPETLMHRLTELMSSAGHSAVAEVAAVCGTRDRAHTLSQIESFANSAGVRGRLTPLPGKISGSADPDVPAWKQGRILARTARGALALNGSQVSDSTLCELIGVSESDAFDMDVPRVPLGMAVRDTDSAEGGAKLLFRKRNRPGRRFEIARLLCDNLIADPQDRWLPSTDEKTSRQKAQRAFAAEFLCPVDALTEFLAGDFSSDSIDEAAERFGVSSQAVENQLVNHHVLPPEMLVETASRFDFPYFTNARSAAIHP